MDNNKRGYPFPIKTVLTGISLVLQLALLIVPVLFFSKSAIWFYSACQVLSICFVIYIINCPSNPSYKITWITFILTLPVMGVVVFLLFGGGRVFPHLKKRMKKCEKKYMAYLPSSSLEEERLIYSDMFHSRQAHYLTNETGFPVYSSTSAKYLPSGELFLEVLLEELKNAEKFIYIEFFILADGIMWSKIYQILREKIKEGVEIKIIFDDFGSIGRQPKNFVKELKNSGIQVSVFNPLRPSVDIFMNNRNHRKIVVIDGNTAFTGGINIGDEYINDWERFGHWLDTGIMLKGRAVQSFTAMFCTMWEFTTGQEIDMSCRLSNQFTKEDGFVLPYCDGPLNDKNPAEGIYMQMLSNAQRYVYIVSPYLILDNNMVNALTLAAKAGIDIRIVVPHKPDKWYVHPVTQYYYDELLSSGVKIYEYTPGFIHAKVFLSDDIVATVGTVNMDYRSFFFHFECGVWMSGNSQIKNIKEQMKDIFNASKEIKLEKWKKRPAFDKIKQSILHLFSPFM